MGLLVDLFYDDDVLTLVIVLLVPTEYRHASNFVRLDLLRPLVSAIVEALTRILNISKLKGDPLLALVVCPIMRHPRPVRDNLHILLLVPNLSDQQ